MAGVLCRFSFATAAEKLFKQRRHRKKHCFLVVGLEKRCLEKGIAKEIENYKSTQLNTLLERSHTEIKKQTWLNLGNDDSISSIVIRTQTEQFLELSSRNLNFFAP